MSVDPTVFIVDDDPACRESVAALVETMGVDVQSFASAEAFLDSYDRCSPGCLVSDFRMRGMTGLELQESLKTQGVTLPAIIITAYADVPVAVRAMKNGAVTFLEKPCREHELWEIIRNALDQDAEQRRRRANRVEFQRRIETLTADERAVLNRIVEGKLNKVIASELGVGLRTVELRRHNVLKKMQANSLAEVVRMVVEAGQTAPPI